MKNLSIVFLALLAFAVLIACGGGQQQRGVTERTVVNVTPRPLTVTPQFGEQEWWPEPATSYSTNPRYPFQPAISNTNGFPITQEITPMRIAAVGTEERTDYDLTLYLEELTNIRLVWDMIPTGTAGAERLSLMFAAGGDDLPDIIYGTTHLSTTFQITAGSAGLLIPLQDLIQDHGHNFLKLIEYDPTVWPAMVSADGNIYALVDRANQTANMVNRRFWIFDPFLTALNMPMPTTTEEYYQYLVGVRDRDPANRGPAGRNDYIPLIGMTNGWHGRVETFLMLAFVYNDDGNRLVRSSDGTISSTVTTPEWRQGLEYLRRLNAEGLLATDSFTITSAEVRAIVESPGPATVGSFPGGSIMNAADLGGTRRTEFRHVPPLRGPNGVQMAYFDEFASLRYGRFAITSGSQIPEIAMKWVDYHYTPDFFTRNRYGVLPRDWFIPPAGTQAISGGPAMYQEILLWGEPNTIRWGDAAVQWDRFASYQRAFSDPYELEYVLWNARQAYWPYRFMNSVPNNLPFTVDEGRTFNDIATQISQYVDQSLAQFVTGRTVLNDANWTAYVRNVENLGLAQMLQVAQSAFNRSWAEALRNR